MLSGEGQKGFKGSSGYTFSAAVKARSLGHCLGVGLDSGLKLMNTIVQL